MEQKDQNKEAMSSIAAERMEGYKNKNGNDLPIDAIKTDMLDLLSKMMSQNKDGIIDPDSNLFNKALSVLMGKKQGAGFVKGGHPKFFLAKPGNNIILNSDTMVHNYVTPIEKLSKDQINYLTQNNTPIVSIGTQLSSADGSCMLAGYLTSKFFTKNQGEMLDSLNNFINKELNTENSSYVCKEPSSGDGGVERSSDWRKDGKFMARIAWPYEDKGVIKWKDHKAIDLLEWEPVVDYIKDTQSLKFIKRFIERYKTKFQKEPVIGKLKVSLRDYVNFFTTEHNDDDDDKWCKPQNNGPKKRSNAASAMTRISLSRNGHGDACLGEERCYDENFDFDGLLAKIIQNNQLKITVEELKRILKKEHKAEDAPTQMFVLAQESEELLKSINDFKSKKTDKLKEDIKCEGENDCRNKNNGNANINTNLPSYGNNVGGGY